MSKAERGKKISEGSNSNGGKLLNEIEAISKALYEDKGSFRSSVTSSHSRTRSSGNVLGGRSMTRRDSEDLSQKDKRSLWNWKSLKAFTNAKNRRFNCCFSLEVHSIEGLPPSFNELRVIVHWKRRDDGLATAPARVLKGRVEFGEKLIHTCSVYGSRSGTHHSAKYEAKHFLLYPLVCESPEHDLGKHRVDLTRLLPLTLEELEEEKSSGKWTTSFKLSGRAKGAIMNVSFGYVVVGDNLNPSGKTTESLSRRHNSLSIPKPVSRAGQRDGTVRRGESLPVKVNQKSSAKAQSSEDIKELHEVLPVSKSELAASEVLYLKDDEEKVDSSADHKLEPDLLTELVEPLKTNSNPVPVSDKQNAENDCEDTEFSVIEQGIELSVDQVKSEEVIIEAATDSTDGSPQVVRIDTPIQDIEVSAEEGSKDSQNAGEPIHDIEVSVEEGSKNSQDEGEAIQDIEVSVEEGYKNPQEVGIGSLVDKNVMLDYSNKEEEEFSTESILKELESALNSVSRWETEALDSPEHELNHTEVAMYHETPKVDRSHSMDDSVASEFLNMLGIEHSPFGVSSESEPESPRERLLRKFEQDALASGSSLFNFGTDDMEQVDHGFGNPPASDWGNVSDEFDLSAAIQAAEEELLMATQDSSKMRATTLEDLETDALMREWGLNEKAFQSSPPKHSTGFGSPIDLPLGEPLVLPSLGEGLGPILQTKNGGFVRSMNPTLFSNAKTGGNLIMQVSSPVVVPAEMGSGIMDILQRLASVGIEKLSMQANKLMPLEDLTGKTMQQVAWEAGLTIEGLERFVSQF